MNLEDLSRTSGEWLRGTGPESDIVMCSRIRLARNLADFPFTNRASRGEKTEIEAGVKQAVGRASLDLSFLDVNAMPNLDRQFRSSASSSRVSSPAAKAPGGSPSGRTNTSR